MTNREVFAYLILGFVLGFLVALWLSQNASNGTRPPPTQPDPCQEAKEPPLDFVEKPA